MCILKEDITQCIDRWNGMFEEKRRISLWLEVTSKCGIVY